MIHETTTTRGLCAVCGQYVELLPIDHRVPILRGMVGYHRPLVGHLGGPDEWCLGSGEPAGTD